MQLALFKIIIFAGILQFRRILFVVLTNLSITGKGNNNTHIQPLSNGKKHIKLHSN